MILFITPVFKITEKLHWLRSNSGRFIFLSWRVILKRLDTVLLMDGTKSLHRLLGILNLPHIATLTVTQQKIKLTSYTVIQLTKPSDVATNMFSLKLLINDIGFPKRPDQCLFAVSNDKLHDTGI